MAVVVPVICVTCVRLHWLDTPERDAARVEVLGVRLVRGAGEDIDLSAPANVREADVVQHPMPLCFQQSTGYSAGPEVDVVLGVLGHLLVNDDVGDLETAARL